MRPMRVATVLTALTICAFAHEASAAIQWGIHSGQSTLIVNADRLAAFGINATLITDSFEGVPHAETLITIDPTSSFVLEEENGIIIAPPSGALRHKADLRLVTSHGEFVLRGLAVEAADKHEFGAFAMRGMPGERGEFDIIMRDNKIAFDRIGQVLNLEVAALAITRPLAIALGDESLTGFEIASLLTTVKLEWIGGDDPPAVFVPADDTGAGPRAATICPGQPGATTGPDVIVGELYDASGGNFTNDGTFDAFAVGTISCNLGDTNLDWLTNSNGGVPPNENRHPVIGQNIFRLKTVSGSARFEHIGQSWLKHGFTALSQNDCCTCSGGGGNHLSVGCSDPYSSSLNSNQGSLGPKSQVNAFAGTHIHPISNPAWSGSTDRRIKIRLTDLNPAQSGGGQYFIEGQYCAHDDSTARNQNNNASYRSISISQAGNEFTYNFNGPMQRMEAGIRAWKDTDATVTETDVPVPSEGLVILAAKVTDLGGGTFHYEYAVQNLTSDRSIQSFTVPIRGSANVTNIGFHDVEYHANEIYDGTDWPGVFSASEGTVSWATTPFATNQNANAIRWGTLYNFRFDANVPPISSTTVTFGLFKPGTPNTVEALTIGPELGPPDCNLNTIGDDEDIASSFSQDCNGNEIPDECEIPVGSTAPGGPFFCVANCNPDCNNNGIPDECEVPPLGTGSDCNSNIVPDECEADCNNDGTINVCETDTDGDTVPDECDNCPSLPSLNQGDWDEDGTGDPCDPDCNPYRYNQHFNVNDGGYRVENVSLQDGAWQWGVPVNVPVTLRAPLLDYDKNGACWLTENATGSTNVDLDGGPTRIISPAIDLSPGHITLKYAYWWNALSVSVEDKLTVEVSNNGGGSWVTVATHTTLLGEWRVNSVYLDALLPMTNNCQIRFSATDGGANNSFVEAAIDAIQLNTGNCDCNFNDIDDQLDLSMSNAHDCDNNGLPDECGEYEYSTTGTLTEFVSMILAASSDPAMICKYDYNFDNQLSGKDIQGYIDFTLNP